MRSNPKPPRRSRTASRLSRSYILYFVLAGFDVMTVSISLYMNHQLMAMYTNSAETNQVWAKRLVRYADLGALAAEVNAPGNDVFESRDVDEASRRLEEGLGRFTRELSDARRDLDRNVSSELSAILLTSLGAAQAAMQTQATEARRIFVHFRNQESNQAGARMAAMDRAYYEVTGALASLTRSVQSIQQAEFDAQATVARSIRRIELLVGGLVAMMVVLIATYGHRLAKGVRATEKELLEAKEASEVASRSKSEFLANMSHEIRTPMTAILGFCETLLEPELPEEDRTNAVHTIQRNGDHLLGLINDILDLSKIEAGRMTIEQIPCSPCEIVAGVQSLIQVRTEAKGLVFAVEYEGPIPQAVLCDPTRLRQILINLIGNAVKFTESGSVRLIMGYSKADAQSTLSFDVTDTGIGMTAEQAAALFAPFTQADTSTTRQFGGSGLGLSISKRLAKLMGGDIELVETEPGVGSRFRATVAAARVPGTGFIDDPRHATVVAPVSTPSETPIDKTPLAQMHILLAEDGLDNQRLIAHVLRKAGAEVTVVDNGKKAIEQALSAKSKEQPFDVILMDMQMPVMDGYEATRNLRDHDYTAPIIALTAHAMATDREKCLATGCDEFATKPIDRKALIALIRRFVGTASTPVLTPTAV